MLRSQTDARRSWRWFGISVVLLVGFVLMIRGLDDLILWADEAWTIYASDPAVSLAKTYDRVVVDIHPPLFFLELHLWREFTGSSVFEMRYFAVLLSLLALALIYRLGSDLLSPGTGLVAAGFLAVNDLFHVFSQEVRHYAQQQLFVVLVMWAYWRFWQRSTRGRGVILVLAGAALLWSYYWGGFVLLGLGIHALVTKRRAILAFVLVFAAMGLLFLPWVPHLVDQYTALPDGLSYSLENTWESYTTLARQLAGMPPSLWLLIALLGVPGTLLPLSRARWRPSAATLLPAIVVATALGCSIALNTQFESLFTRSLGIVLPSLALLLGHTVAQLRWPESGLVAMMLVVLALTLEGAAPVPRAAWDDVADMLARHTTSDELLLLEMNYRQNKDLEELTLRFYLDRAGPHVRTLGTDTLRHREPQRFAAILDQQLGEADHLWVLKLGWPYDNFRDALRGRGYVDTAPTITFDPFGALPVELWRLDRPPAGAALNTFGDVLDLRWRSVEAGESWVTVNLLWEPTTVPERNYTVSTLLLNDQGALVSQHDSYPLENRSPTEEWNAGELYFDSHVIPTAHVPTGEYRVAVQVYTFTDATFQNIEQLPVADCDTQPDCALMVLDSVTLP